MRSPDLYIFRSFQDLAELCVWNDGVDYSLNNYYLSLYNVYLCVIMIVKWGQHLIADWSNQVDYHSINAIVSIIFLTQAHTHTHTHTHTNLTFPGHRLQQGNYQTLHCIMKSIPIS